MGFVTVQLYFPFQVDQFTIHSRFDITLLLQLLEQFAVVSFPTPYNRCQAVRLGSLRQAHYRLHNLIRSLFGHSITRNIGVGCGRSGIEKAKKVVDFSDGTYGGSRISVGGFLIDRDDWGASINKIDFRTLHHSNELTGVGRQRSEEHTSEL